METLQVLVCDDEPGMRMSIARALRDFTFTVADVNAGVRLETDLAETGEEAVAKIDAAPPHILLLDHKLPGISGLDVLEHIASKKMDMLTIMITAYASIETAVRATRQGAYDFLAKPFTPAELKNAVRKAAEHVIVAQHARTLAREKRQVRFEFISVLAHELKAPLGAIEGYLQVLHDGSAGDDPTVYRQIIDRCITRTAYMRKMILDLLDLTRIESGQKKRELVEVDVVAAARTAIETAMPDARSRDIRICLLADQPVTMQADAGEIEIILNNLVSNAVKYNRDGGSVEVKIGETDDTVMVSVSDTGIGMSEEECAKIFNDFVRIKNRKTRDILGSGLGLSIVKKLAVAYGGDATVISRPDVGSTFTVTLKKAFVSAETTRDR
ncbi:MAG TPA: hybrid sensor histidine kinase/response regulator [Candidatus Hydrogenedentes bacterium]|nr:hybrid sensor histidine kinase/response regulator [Candidatus Hydrogenedentota bacterium]